MNKQTEYSPLEISRYVDEKTYHDVRDFHEKTNYTLRPELHNRCYLSLARNSELKKFEYRELSMYPGFKGGAIKLKSNIFSNVNLTRNDSAKSFIDYESINFDSIDQLLKLSFGPKKEGSRKRPYPSGGAMYPIEVFLCKLSSKIENWPVSSSVFHLMPSSGYLEGVSKMKTESILDCLSGGDFESIGAPHFALVYAICFEKSIFKYRQRGYRLALMEAGSMYQMADLNGKVLGLNNRVWAGFSDHHVGKCLGVNPCMIAPLAVQFFGQEG
jgi:SagB-type dehydrogenase family enzyme